MNTEQIADTAEIGQSGLTDGLGGYSDEERYLHEILAHLQEQYAKAAQPYVDRLAAIHAVKMPAPMIITIEQARELGLIPPNA